MFRLVEAAPPGLALLAGKACGALRHEHFVLGAVVG